MKKPTFKHHDLRLLNPSFSSPLVDVLGELEKLRQPQFRGELTPFYTFMQLKSIFHIVESIGSARIEGNHTTLSDYVESKISGEEQTDQIREIDNIDAAMRFIEKNLKPGELITETFIRELHELTVANLDREGDRTPGEYRSGRVIISKSEHLPPEDKISVRAYMEELVKFINNADKPKYELMKVALSHHRFGWIHPFGNGNGRVVRLLTYAQLIKYGFAVSNFGRLLNPTAVFCNNRDTYYENLAIADHGTEDALEHWCLYVLNGILTELTKIEKLAEKSYTQQNILDPALKYARERRLITSDEFAVLLKASKCDLIKSADVAEVLPNLTDNQRTYLIRKLVSNNMLKPREPGSRQYFINFEHSVLVRGLIQALRLQDFIPGGLSG